MPTTAADVTALIGTLQGRWLPIYQEVDGQMVPPAEYAMSVVEMTGNDFKVLKGPNVEYEGRFTVDSSSSPARIALIYTKSLKPVFTGGAHPGVVQVAGDTLKWCFASVGQSPPHGLNTTPGADAVLSIYQKEGSTITPDARVNQPVLW